jgi:hypothetical protein
MIKVYSSGVICHIFEVDREEVRVDSTGLVERMHYEAVPGSLAYIKDHKIYNFTEFMSFSAAYPKDDCRNPTKEELALYDEANVI